MLYVLWKLLILPKLHPTTYTIATIIFVWCYFKCIKVIFIDMAHEVNSFRRESCFVVRADFIIWHSFCLFACDLNWFAHTQICDLYKWNVTKNEKDCNKKTFLKKKYWSVWVSTIMCHSKYSVNFILSKSDDQPLSLILRNSNFFFQSCEKLSQQYLLSILWTKYYHRKDVWQRKKILNY